MSRSPSIPDRPRLELDPNMTDSERLDALREHYAQILTVHDELSDRLEQAKEQREGLQERVEKLERENETLKTASLYIATVEEILDDELVVKQHGNNQEIVTPMTDSISEQIDPGARVAVNDSFSIQGILEDETDSRAQAMEITESPDVRYEDIGGLEEQIRDVRETVEFPLESPDMFADVGIEPPAGLLLYGPPGTGKTMLAKAVANHTNATFIKLAGSELVHKFIGEGARLVRDLFQLAEDREPAIVFIDEIDAIASKRTDSKTSGDAEVQRTMMQLLANMDGFDTRGNIRLIAATNRFDMLDEAILRPGRFDRLIEVTLPEEEARSDIFKIHTRNMNIASDVDFEKLGELTEGLSGADIKAICTESGLFSIRDDRTEITMQDFRNGIQKLSDEGGPSTIISSNGTPAFY